MTDSPNRRASRETAPASPDDELSPEDHAILKDLLSAERERWFREEMQRRLGIPPSRALSHQEKETLRKQPDKGELWGAYLVAQWLREMADDAVLFNRNDVDGAKNADALMDGRDAIESLIQKLLAVRAAAPRPEQSSPDAVHPDTARLDWLDAHREVEWHAEQKGEGEVEQVLDYFYWQTRGQCSTIREAIDHDERRSPAPQPKPSADDDLIF